MSELTDRLGKMSMCVYLAAEASVADDIADGLRNAIARITELEASLADSNEALQVMGLKLAHAEEENARLWAGHERYEIVRRLNAHQFTELFRESISKNKRFDDLVDALNNQSHSANTVGEREACPACGDDVEHVWCLISPEGKRFTGDTKMAAYREEASSRIPATEQLANIMRANAECEAEYQADLEQARKQGYQSGYAAGLEVNSANTVGGPTPVMDAAPAWEMMAIAWLRGKAAGQAQNNERWPDHAKCYPRWTLYVDIAQELANELEREHQKREDTRTAGESDS